MFLPVVSKRSNPASSAAVSRSPFVSLSQPCCAAVRSVEFEIRAGWNRRSLIENDPHLRHVCGRLIETADGELDNRLDLFAIEPVEPFHDVVYIGPSFQIFEDGGYWHPRTLQNPCAAHLAGDTFAG